MGTLINNRYKIIKELGRGGMGIIYLVFDTLKKDHPYALKTIRQDILERAQLTGIKSIKTEYDIMTRLKHPNFVRVYDFGTYENNYYILMEYLSGELLSDIIESENELKKEDILNIIIQLLRGIQYIHSRNIIYRDIKPSNIIISDKVIKLLDFGLSDIEHEKEDKIKGTVSYLAPEVLDGKIDFHVDIFSMGILFYELISNTPFYSKSFKSLRDIFDLLGNEDRYRDYVRNLFERFPERSLISIISKMIEFNSSDRYDNCSEIIKDINRAKETAYFIETPQTVQSYTLGSSFINRKKEFNYLIKYIHSRNPKMLIFSGSVGLGKTRLFGEFKKYCRLNNLSFFEAFCNEGSGNYHSITEIILQILLNCKVHIINKYGSALKLLLPDLPVLSNYPDIIIEKPELLKEIIIQNIIDLIIDASAFFKVIIIYFNDIQWLDEGSSEILTLLLARIKSDSLNSIRIYSSINEDKLSLNAPVNKLLASKTREKRKVLSFNESDVSSYIKSIFGYRFIDENIRRSSGIIHSMTGGNPLFLQEILKTLIEKGYIIRDHISWRLVKDIRGIKISSDLKELLRDKLEIIMKDKQSECILEPLSFLRIEPEISLLISLCDDDSVNFINILSNLEEIEIIQEKQIKSKVHIRFASSLLKEVIAENVPKGYLLHSKIAKGLERRKGSLELYSEEIAYHYLRSGNRGKAVEYLIISGDNAQISFYHRKAIDFYDSALKELDPCSKTKSIELNIKKASSLHIIGKTEEAISLAKECLVLSEKGIGPEFHSLWIKASNLYGKILLKTGKVSRALEIFKKSMEKSREHHGKDYYETIINLAHLYMIVADYDRARELLQLYNSWCKANNDRRGIGMTSGRMGLIHMYKGEYDKALKSFNENLRICKDENDLTGLSYAYNNIGNLFNLLSEHSKALRYFRLKKDISKKIGDKREIGNAIGNMGMVYNALNNKKRAMECLIQNQQISREIGDKISETIVLLNMGNLYFTGNELEEAYSHYDQAMRMAVKTGDKLALSKILHNIGVIYFKTGRYKKAVRTFHRKLRIVHMIGDKWEIASSFDNISYFYEIMNNHKLSLKYNNEACKYFKEMGKKDSLFHSLIRTAKVLAKLNKYKQALKASYEASELTLDIDDATVLLKLQITENWIKGLMGDKSSIKELIKLSENKYDKETMAIINEYLFMILKDKKYSRKAVRLYKSLYKKTLNHLFLNKIEEL